MLLFLVGCLGGLGTLEGSSGPDKPAGGSHDTASGEDSGGGGGGGGGGTAEVTLESLSLDPGSLDLGPREVGDVSAVAHWSDGSTSDVTADTTWSTSNEDVAGIWVAGRVQPLGPGTTFVNASYEGEEAKADVTVSGYADVASGDLVFNEVLADPASGADENGDGNADVVEDEFVELVNVSGASLDLGGLTLYDADNAGERHTVPDGTILLPGEALVVFGGGSVASLHRTHAVFQVCDDGVTGLDLGLALSNDGDTIRALARDGSTVTTMSYADGDASDEALQLRPELTGSAYTAAGPSPGTLSDGSAMPGPDGWFSP